MTFFSLNHPEEHTNCNTREKLVVRQRTETVRFHVKCHVIFV